jgi:hypothetical protein
MVITSFTNEYELQKVVQRCHNVLWERHGFDPAQAFDEFSKLLFVKLYDEVTLVGARTAIQRRESPGQFAARVRSLFDQANETPGFDHIFTEDMINADDLAIYEVFHQLQNYKSALTPSSIFLNTVRSSLCFNRTPNTSWSGWPKSVRFILRRLTLTSGQMKRSLWSRPVALILKR